MDHSLHDYWAASGGLTEFWFPVMESAELKLNQITRLMLFGKPIVIVRLTPQKITALIDQCVHRGVPLSDGVIREGCLVCPYHGWHYDSCGQVVRIPSIDGFDEPRKHPYKQRSFDVLEADGLIWLYLGNKQEADRPTRYSPPFYNRSGWVSYYMVGTYDAELDAVAQNIMDVSHTVFVHDKVFRSESGRTVHAEVEISARSVKVSYDDTDNNVGMMPWLTNPHRAPQVHTDTFIAPNVTLVEYHWGEPSGIVFNSIIVPISPTQSKVFTCVSYKLVAPMWLMKWIKPLVKAYTWMVNKQDMRVLLQRSQGLQRLPQLKQHSVQADIAHVAITKILQCIQHEQAPEEQIQRKKMIFRI